MERQQKRILTIHGFGGHFERTEEFEGSFYRNVYKEAYIKVEDIITQSEMALGYCGNSVGNTYVLPLSQQPELPNILTFVGERGSGKTSVMRSFMESLKDYYRNRNFKGESGVFYDFSRKDGILFTCLDCIDGSVMEHGEDIFKTILAQLYQKFMDLETSGEIRKGDDFDFRKRELLQGLENIYKTVCDIETMEKGQTMAGEAYMHSLQSFSSGQKVRKEFVRLINNFTNLMLYKHQGRIGKHDEHYVVIAIDDIDLNINNSFSMLEKINRYCTVPNVIVLLTMDIQQMLAITIRSFYEVVPKIDQMLSEQEANIRALSVKYLEKVLPISYRIYMPSLGNPHSFGDVALILDKEEESIKKSILGKVYRRTVICFDSQGLKKHFYEPDSMRHLTGIYLLLDSMNKPKLETLNRNSKEKPTVKDVEVFERIFEENYDILISDIENRMAFEKLNSQTVIKFFKKLTSEDAPRAMSSVNDFYHDCMENELEEVGAPVTYGELIEIIYRLGRIKNGAYKKLVHCLLAYFSYEFTRKYIAERIKALEEKVAQDVEAGKWKTGEMEELAGGSLLYTWVDDLVPRVRVEMPGMQGTQESSSGSEPKTWKRVAKVERIELSTVFTFEIPETVEARDKEGFSDYYEKIAKTIRDVELQCLFFSNIVGSRSIDEEYPWKFAIGSKKTAKRVLVYDNKLGEEVQSVTGEFNFANIIINSMYGSQKLACVEEAIRQNVGKELAICSAEGAWKSEFKRVLEKYSLRKKYEEWEKEYGGGATMPLPIWWLDFSYNVLKRIRQKQKKLNPGTCRDENDLYFYTKQFFDCVCTQLKDQQIFYESSKIRIVETFSTCPAIKCILAKNDEKCKAYAGGSELLIGLYKKLLNLTTEEKR